MRRTSTGPRRGSVRIDEAFKAADKNSDSKLTHEEYPKPELFDAIDANKDGFATIEEIKSYYAKQRGKAAPDRKTQKNVVFDAGHG